MDQIDIRFEGFDVSENDGAYVLSANKNVGVYESAEDVILSASYNEETHELQTVKGKFYLEVVLQEQF